MTNRKGIIAMDLLLCTLGLCIGLVLAVVAADRVFIDGRDTVADAVPSYTGITNVVYGVGTTNMLNARLITAVFGSTGITNIWSGSAEAYGAIQAPDSKTLYLIQE